MTKSLRLTENELFLLLKQKNEKAYSCLYDQYAAMIYGVILRELKSDTLAAEILKSTFINIVIECENIDCVKQSLFTWLLKLTKRTANAEFKVNLDFKSLLLPRFKAMNHPEKETHYRSDYDSSSSYFSLNGAS